MTDQANSRREPTAPPKQWGFTDDELAREPIVFRDDLLKGQVFLVSGGGGGFGRGMAYMLVRLGAEVVICGRREDKLEAAAEGIKRRLGREVMTQAMTIRDPAQVEALMARIWERYGRLDTLVNNAGGQFPQPALDFSVKGWNAVIDTNLNGTWYMTQAAGRRWRETSRPGNVVNIVAVVDRGMPQVAHTCAARAGVIHLSRTLAVEWAPLKIRVNCVAPGSIASDGLNVYDRTAADEHIYSNPMFKLGDVFDVAHAVVYLSAPSGKFITGETVYVDGGRQHWGEDWPGGIPEYFRTDKRGR